MNINTQKKPDIIIVDDHLIFRQGLKAIINFEDVGTVIAEASNGEDFLEILKKLNPDLVLMDIDMPNMNGFEATQKALEILPDLKIIAFTVFSETEYYTKMKEIGAKGFILKSSGFNELENAIKIVMNGDSYFDNKLKTENNTELVRKEALIALKKECDILKNKNKMLFFPWVLNQRDCVDR